MANLNEEFEKQLQTDGLPCLWPHAPNWLMIKYVINSSKT